MLICSCRDFLWIIISAPLVDKGSIIPVHKLNNQVVDPDWEDASRDSGKTNEKLSTNFEWTSSSKRTCQHHVPPKIASLFRQHVPIFAYIVKSLYMHVQ